MVRQLLDDRFDRGGVGLLDGHADGPVQGTTPFLGDFLVDGLSDPAVRQTDHRPAVPLRLQRDEPQPVEPFDRVLDCLFVQARRQCDGLRVGRPVEDRQDLHHQPLAGGQGRQALHDGAREARRQADGVERAAFGDPGPAVTPERSLFGERLHQLFQVQRISRGAVGQNACEALGPLLERDHRGQELGHLFGVEWIEGDRQDARGAGEAFEKGCDRRRACLFVPQAADEEPGAAAWPEHEVLQEIDSGRVAPVQILEEHDAAHTLRHVHQRLPDGADELLLAESLRRPGAGGLPLPRGRLGRHELVDDRPQFGRQLRRTSELPQDLDEWMEGHAAVLVAASGQIADAGELQPVLQLAEQPTLADSAWTAQQHQSRQSVVGLGGQHMLRRQLHQRAQLPVAAHEPPRSHEAGVGFGRIDPVWLRQAGVQSVQRSGRAGRTGGGSAFHERHDERLEALWNRGVQLTGRPHFASQDRSDHLAGFFSLVRQRSREYLVQDDTQGIEVGTLVDVLVSEALGGDVMQRPAETGPGRFGLAVGQPEIEELHLERRVDHDVVGLDVVVQEATRVDVIEGPQALHGQAIEALDELGTPLPAKILPLHIFHRQKMPAVALDRAEVVDLGEVRMAQARHGAELFLEELDGLAVEPLGPQELQGDLPAPLVGIPHQVHRSHASFAKEADNGIPLVDETVRTFGHRGGGDRA